MEKFKSLALWAFIIVLAVVLYVRLQNTDKRTELDLTAFSKLVKKGAIKGTVVDRSGELTGRYSDEFNTERAFVTRYLDGQAEFVVNLMTQSGIPYQAKQPSAILMPILSFIAPLIVVLLVMFFIMRQLQSGGAKAMSFGKSRARRVMEGETGKTFDDVAGCDEAKEELKEVVDFLKNPQKYTRLGGKMPKGVLLVGPPGTGKTLLARAVAGEARVPFFSISGSDFVEMFVGVGAARVRDLFEQGKKTKPALIFIDEIDAVGRQRFAGIGGGHDEREQTLNQLLVEMDGFDTNEGVILLAGTNRPDVLDKALLRPGRFDRTITVDMPDLKGREAILRIHARSVRLAEDVDFERIARATPGFSGAHLENLINEAALMAARNNMDKVGHEQMEEARDRVLMGPERRSLVMSPEERESTAYHEAGHAFVAFLTPGSDPVHKVTIIPRGRALGRTMMHPLEDIYSHSEKRLKAMLTHLMGGRVAEEIKFGQLNSGASSDLRHATELARRMICEFGMSERLGARTFGQPDDEVFYARDYARAPAYSEATAAMIDEEIKLLLDEATGKARQMLREHRDAFERVALALLDRETLDGEELKMLIEGKELPPLFRAGDAARPSAKPEPASPPPLPKKASPDLQIKPQPGLSTP